MDSALPSSRTLTVPSYSVCVHLLACPFLFPRAAILEYLSNESAALPSALLRMPAGCPALMGTADPKQFLNSSCLQTLGTTGQGNTVPQLLGNETGFLLGGFVSLCCASTVLVVYVLSG